MSPDDEAALRVIAEAWLRARDFAVREPDTVTIPDALRATLGPEVDDLETKLFLAAPKPFGLGLEVDAVRLEGGALVAELSWLARMDATQSEHGTLRIAGVERRDDGFVITRLLDARDREELETFLAWRRERR